MSLLSSSRSTSWVRRVSAHGTLSPRTAQEEAVRLQQRGGKCGIWMQILCRTHRGVTPLASSTLLLLIFAGIQPLHLVFFYCLFSQISWLNTLYLKYLEWRKLDPWVLVPSLQRCWFWYQKPHWINENIRLPSHIEKCDRIIYPLYPLYQLSSGIYFTIKD